MKRKREEKCRKNAYGKWQTAKAVVVKEESYDCIFIFFLLFTIIAGINVCES